jgi:UDP-N-acetylglucosamine:LPS N-acetylglucosamine transferase
MQYYILVYIAGHIELALSLKSSFTKLAAEEYLSKGTEIYCSNYMSESKQVTTHYISGQHIITLRFNGPD